ncbi:MAG: diguanylate cyclase [Clostridia bacterium]|nr:diguanylate cyclase [Clostridia bacterium]
MKLSLTKKIVILITCVAIVIGTFAIAVYNKGLYDVIIDQYGHYSFDVCKLVAVELDTEPLVKLRDAVLEIYDKATNRVMSDQWGTPEFEEYVSQYEHIVELDEYKAVLAQLRRMQEQLDVNCLYITWTDIANECNVYLVDAALEDPCPPGCIDPIFSDDPQTLLKNISGGLKPTISRTPEYGWIIASGMPVFDSQGEIVATAAADISMNNAMDELMGFMRYISLAFLALTIIVCVIAILVMNKLVVKPINRLSNAASQYKTNKNSFSELNISRKDEIGVLADSMVQMEKDIDQYINDLTSARERADEMDKAANIDALTKVRNKRAYDVEVERLNGCTDPYGIVIIDLNGLKSVNDNYGHEKGDISIKTVCRIICTVFKHSPVYRVGGDEFIVLLENRDYDNRDQLLANVKESFRVNEADDSLPPWECVSGAVGCAVCDREKGENADDVLKRADEAMYENKKTFK